MNEQPRNSVSKDTFSITVLNISFFVGQTDEYIYFGLKEICGLANNKCKFAPPPHDL